MIRSKMLETYLVLAAESKNIEEVKLLLMAGANVHADDNYALRCAALYGYTQIVKLVLMAGADVHAVDNEALNCASLYGYTEIVKLLNQYMKNKTE